MTFKEKADSLRAAIYQAIVFAGLPRREGDYPQKIRLSPTAMADLVAAGREATKDYFYSEHPPQGDMRLLRYPVEEDVSLKNSDFAIDWHGDES
jgi:hypothetical protein